MHEAEVRQTQRMAFMTGDWVITALCAIALGEDPGMALDGLPEATEGRFGASTLRAEALEGLGELRRDP